MFKNRIQISRLSSVDGLVCNAGDLELGAWIGYVKKTVQIQTLPLHSQQSSSDFV